MSGRLGERLEESPFRFLEASFPDERHRLAKRRRLLLRLSRERREKKDQDRSSAKIARAAASPLAPAAQPA